MNHSFDHVTIHTGASVNRAARLIGADAFTIGSDIYFSDEAYAPGTPFGDRVLAHELTHVVQHDEGSIPDSSSEETSISKPTDPLEVEAYTKEGDIAHDVGALRSGDAISVAALTPTAPAPSVAAPLAAPPVASEFANGLASREEAEPGTQRPPAVRATNGAGGEAGPSSYGALIPPVPERASPLETTAPLEVPSLADAESRVAPPATPPVPQAETTQTAGPPQPSQPVAAPELESSAPETHWLTAPMDLGVSQLSTGPEPSTRNAPAVPSAPSGTTSRNVIAAARAGALEAEVRSATASLEAAGAASLESITSQVAQMTASVHAEATLSRARVNAAYDEQRARVSSERESAVATISQSRDRQHEAISTFAESERDRLHAARQTEEATATSLVEQLRADALATGESEAQRATEGTEQRAQTILAEAEAVGGTGDQTSAEAQREAARRIAQDAADKCHETGDRLASDVREEASLQSGKYDEMLQDFLEKLQQSVEAAEPHIDEFASHATELVTSRAEQALAAAEEMASQSTTALDDAQSSAGEQIQAWEDQAIAAISDSASQLRGPFSAQIDSMRAELSAFGADTAGQLRSMQDATTEEVEAAHADARARLRQANDNTAGRVAEFDANTATQLNGMLEELRANLAATIDERTIAAAETGARMSQMLRDAGQTAVTGIEEAVSAYRESLAAGMNDSIREMTDNGSQFRSNLQNAHTEAMSKFATLINDGLASEDGFLTDARAEIASAVARIAREYETLKAEADQRESSEAAAPATRIHRGIWDTITGWVDSVRHWFADTFGEFWGGLIFGILAALVIVVVGLLIGWAVGAIVGLFVVAAKVAIVTLIVLLVIAIPLNIYNRFQEFYADHPREDAGFWRGLGLVGLGIADLVGIPYIIEASVGRRAFSPRPMTPFERGERLGMGIVFFGAALVSIKGMLRARPRPEIQPTPDPATGRIPKMSPPPGLTNQEMANVMKWGDGPSGIPETRARIGTLTRGELVRGGVTRQLAEGWRDFYINEAARNPYDPVSGRGNPQAAPRADLMRRAVDLLGTAPSLPVPVTPPRSGGDDEDQTQRKPEEGHESTAFPLGNTLQMKIAVGRDADLTEEPDLPTRLSSASQRASRLNAAHQSSAAQRRVHQDDEDDETAPTSEDAQTLVQPELAAQGSLASTPGANESTGTATGNTADPSSSFSAAVSHGLQGATRPLPELERIQESFGAHDVSGVRVQVGGPAAQSNQLLGARAYTSGNRIAFRQEPDVRLAAHEAAHVVQQRQGIHLEGGVGQPGDVYEQQADRAADAVAAGESAAPILSALPNGQDSGSAVQKACDCGGTCEHCQGTQETEEDAPVQHKLEVNAARVFEPPQVIAPEPEAKEEQANDEGAGEAPVEKAEAQEEEGSALDAAEANDSSAPDAGAPSPTGGDTGSTRAGGARQTETSGAGEPACQSSGGGIHAEKYTEDWEDPDEDKESEDEPEDPPATEAEEDMDSESTEVDEVDNCPVEEAIESQAPASADETAEGEETAEGSSAERTGEPRPREAPAQGGGPPEARAMETQVAANEASGEAALSPIEAAITQAEAQRGEAVVAYQNSAERLESNRQSNGILAQAVDFSSEDGESESATQQQAAGQRAREFFAGAAGKIDEVVDLALNDVPDRLGGRAESIKTEIGGAMITAQTAISRRIRLARRQAAARAARARPRIAAQHRATVANMEAATTAAINEITTNHTTVLSRIDELETLGLDDINSMYATSRLAHEQLGVTVGGEAHSHGEAYYNAYEAFKINESDGFFIGHLTDRRAEAQQNASRETAKGYRESLEKTAKDQAKEAMKGRKKDRCGVIAAARRTRTTLDARFNELVESLQKGLEDATKKAAAQRDQLLASIDATLRSTNKALDQQENNQRQAANDTGYLQQVAIEQAAHSAAASIQSSVAVAAESAQRALLQIRTSFAEAPAPDQESLGLLLGKVDRTLSGALGGLNTQVEGGTAGVEGRLDGTRAKALVAVANVIQNNEDQATGVVAGISSSLNDLVAKSGAAFTQQTGQYRQQVQAATAGGLKIFETLVTEFDKTIGRITGSVELALIGSEKELEKTLRRNLAGIDCEIPKQAMKAASKEQPAWKTVVAVLLIIAVILVVMLVAGPALMALAGGIATSLGAGAAAGAIGTLVGGALAGALASAAIQVIQNWRTGQKLTEGVGEAAIMGAVGGFLGAGAGALIGRFVSGAVLQFAANMAADALLEVGTELLTGSKEFSWENFGVAMAISLASSLVGGHPRIRRIQTRMMFHGAKVVPGARAQAYAEKFRPTTAPEVTTGMPHSEPAVESATPPQTKTEVEPTATPRTDTEVEPTVTPHTKTEAEPGTTTRTETEAPQTPINRRSNRQLQEANISRKIGNSDHTLGPMRIGDEVRMGMCSTSCGSLVDKIDGILAQISAKGPTKSLHARLTKLRERVAAIDAGINDGSIPFKRIPAETNRGIL